MRRLSGLLLAGAMLTLPAFTPAAFAQAKKFTIEGDMAVMTVSVSGAKTAEYEKIMTRLKESLTKSTAPEAKQQLAGWRIVKAAKPNADGTVYYMHMINPVPNADYTVLELIFATTPDAEKRAIYDEYIATGAKTIGLSTGMMVLDFSK
jgi:hypothetical protein